MKVRWLWLPTLLAAGCDRPSDQQQEDRPFDAFVDCLPGGSSGEESVEEAVARVDRNGDGTLTAEDLRGGESLVVLRIDGVHIRSDSVAPTGYSIHSDMDGVILTGFPDWAVSFDLNCRPMADLAMWFGAPGKTEKGEFTRPFELFGYGVPSHEVGTTTDVGFETEGQVVISYIDDETASGHLQGRGKADLWGQLPDDFPTGQSVEVVGFAFRDVRIY